MRKIFPRKDNNNSHPKNVEVIYEGSKSFWRHRISVDIYIVHYTIHDTIEVVCFLPHSAVEAPRIYISFPTLVSRFDPNELEEKINHGKEVFIRQRKPFDTEAIVEKAKRDLAVSFIVAKIEIQPLSGHGFQVVFVEKVGRDEHLLFTSRPEGLNPLHINHNPITSADDFRTTLKQFREESKAVQSHNEKAITALHHGQSFEEILAFKLQHDREMKLKYSRAKLRWIHAINKVVIQNYVRKVRARIAEIDERTKVKRATRRNNLEYAKENHKTLDNSFLDTVVSKLPSIGKSASAALITPRFDNYDSYNASVAALFMSPTAKAAMAESISGGSGGPRPNFLSVQQTQPGFGRSKTAATPRRGNSRQRNNTLDPSTASSTFFSPGDPNPFFLASSSGDGMQSGPNNVYSKEKKSPQALPELFVDELPFSSALSPSASPLFTPSTKRFGRRGGAAAAGGGGGGGGSATPGGTGGHTNPESSSKAVPSILNSYRNRALQKLPNDKISIPWQQDEDSEEEDVLMASVRRLRLLKAAPRV